MPAEEIERMRYFTSSLHKEYVYPCSKSDVKAAFGNDLLDSACFGLSTAFSFDSRTSPQPKILGTVLMGLTAPRLDDSILPSLYIYRISKEDFGARAHAAVAELMKGEMRRWLDVKIQRSKTEIFGLDELLVEFRSGRLILHETRFR